MVTMKRNLGLEFAAMFATITDHELFKYLLGKYMVKQLREMCDATMQGQVERFDAAKDETLDALGMGEVLG